jgi:hypothetical protein
MVFFSKPIDGKTAGGAYWRRAVDGEIVELAHETACHTPIKEHIEFIGAVGFSEASWLRIRSERNLFLISLYHLLTWN